MSNFPFLSWAELAHSKQSCFSVADARKKDPLVWKQEKTETGIFGRYRMHTPEGDEGRSFDAENKG